MVILEKSGEPFKETPKAWIHKSGQDFDTRLKMELPQKYVFIALDMFRRISQNEIEGELEAWMHLLSSDNPEVIGQIVEKYPVFKEIYEEIEAFRQDIGGVLDMFSDALRIMDRNTVQLMIDEMQEELEETKGKVREQADEIKQQAKALEEKEDELEKKDERIKELENLLKSLER